MERLLTAPAARSLVDQARRLSPPVEQPPEVPDAETFDDEAEQTRILADGYRRVSPVQPYYIPPSWRKRQRWILLASVALLVVVVIAVVYLIGHLM